MKYQVTITELWQRSGTILVDAESESDAEALAIVVAKRELDVIHWDDGFEPRGVNEYEMVFADELDEDSDGENGPVWSC